MEPGMELRHLRYFATVAETASFTRAAEVLHTVQPSLSRQIQDLEREIGVRLLDRSSRKIELTQAAQSSSTRRAWFSRRLNAPWNGRGRWDGPTRGA